MVKKMHSIVRVVCDVNIPTGVAGNTPRFERTTKICRVIPRVRKFEASILAMNGYSSLLAIGDDYIAGHVANYAERVQKFNGWIDR